MEGNGHGVIYGSKLACLGREEIFCHYLDSFQMSTTGLLPHEYPEVMISSTIKTHLHRMNTAVSLQMPV
jgi:hypothetical protein